MENVVNPRRSRCIYLAVWILWGLAPENLVDGHRGPILARSTHIASLDGGIFADDEAPDH